ncbi:EpsG family protein [Limosilactobacillus fermentum]|uniref:EpsG family protein n=1 Tax=Limosilactobacillus fermentum TaxID=1613 RepID=UPI0019644351|nr:EpsG family protein [Limosilactobacillus fermentum]MBM9561372.1 EpsG family protein [Limosilactobacillus fermentum]
MKLLTIYVSLLFLSFIFKRSKIVMVLDFILMWIMMGWNYGSADYNVYVNRYIHPELYGTLEPFYSFLQNISKGLGWQYPTFLIAMSGFALLLRFVTISLLTDNVNEVIGLWMIFPFIADINQVREFYATSISFLGIAIFLKSGKTKRNLIIATALCFIAGLIHVSAFLYLILLVPYFKREKLEQFVNNDIAPNIKSYLMVVGIIYILALSGVLSVVGNILIGTKWSQTAEAASMAYTSKTFYFFEMILFFVLSEYILKNILNNHNNLSLRQDRLVKWIYKSNVLLLSVLAFAVITPDIYRVQQEFAIFIYCASSYYPSIIFNKRYFVTLNGVVVKLTVIYLAIVFLWLMCLAVPSLRDGVFIPAFYNNLLIN